MEQIVEEKSLQNGFDSVSGQHHVVDIRHPTGESGASHRRQGWRARGNVWMKGKSEDTRCKK